MRLKTLILNGYKGFEKEISIEFSSQTTAIIGVNGSGKTSVLDGINLMLSRLYTAFMLDKHFVDDLRLGEAININSSNAFGNLIIHFSDKKEFSSFFQIERQNDSIELGDSLKHLSFDFLGKKYIHKRNLPIPIFYPTERAVGEISLNKKDKDFYTPNNHQEALHNAFSSKADFKTFFEWFKEREDYENEMRLNENPDFRLKELNAVRKAIAHFLDDFEKLRVKRHPKLELVVRKGEEELSISQLSHGERIVLAMVGDMAKRLSLANPLLENPLEGQAVVMIDEIELHLHPSWQRKIIKNLERTFPNCQFIITTHSPQVLSEIDAQDKVVLLKNNQAYPLPISYGRDSNWILDTIMQVPSRPVEVKEQLKKYFKLIDNGELEQAEELRTELENQIGSDEPEFIRGDLLIRRKKKMRK